MENFDQCDGWLATMQLLGFHTIYTHIGAEKLALHSVNGLRDLVEQLPFSKEVLGYDIEYQTERERVLIWAVLDPRHSMEFVKGKCHELKTMLEDTDTLHPIVSHIHQALVAKSLH